MTMYNVQLPEQLWFNTFFWGGGALNFFTKRGQILCTMLMMFQTSTSR